METAFAWIGQIAEWFGRFVPRREIVDTTEMALKFKHGSEVVVCGPGLHWYFPWTTKWVLHPTARQPIRLRTQTISLKDDKTVAVGTFIVFEIKDVEAAVAHNYEVDETVGDITSSAVHDVCSQLTWAEITEQNRSGELDRKLKAEARKELERYGIKVVKVTLTDLAPVRVLKIVHDGQNH